MSSRSSICRACFLSACAALTSALTCETLPRGTAASFARGTSASRTNSSLIFDDLWLPDPIPCNLRELRRYLGPLVTAAIEERLLSVLCSVRVISRTHAPHALARRLDAPVPD